MAPMYDEDEDLWTGGALSKEIAQQRLDEQRAAELAKQPSVGDRVLGGIKGAVGGATTGFELGGPWGAFAGGVLGAGAGAMGAQKNQSTPGMSEAKEAVSLGKDILGSTDKAKALKEVAENPMLDLSDADLAD